MAIECMCVVCHGPIKRSQYPVSAVVCRDDGGNCKQVWARMRRGQPLPWKYQDLRWLHAQRREHEAFLNRIEQLVGQRSTPVPSPSAA